jgi:hypothetical protein
MSATTTKRRVARKIRECSCDRLIGPGDVYLEHTAFPGDEAGYATSAGRPVRLAECSYCATRYGRGGLLVAAS